jgi:type IV pilus assembly protein PilC
MKFKFKAVKPDGSKYEDIRESNDKFSLYEELKKDGIVLISASESTKSKWDIEIPIFNSIPEHQKIIFAKNLGSMINAGLPMVKGLNILEKQIINKRFKEIIVSLEAEIKKGRPLSDACVDYPNVFPKLFTAMVKAGEESGKISESLQIVASQMEESFKLKGKLKGAMIYPSVILCVMVIIGVLMMIFVVPGITSTFAESGQALPLPTKLLIWLSDFVKNDIVFIIIGVILLVIGLRYVLRTKKGARVFDFIALRIPVVGNLMKESTSASITRTVSSLLSSGVPYTEAITITKDVIQNSYYKDMLTTAISVVEKGGALSGVFLNNLKLCPVFVGEMMVVGEETGRLPDMLSQVAVYYEESVNQSTKDMSTIIEPVLMVFIGAAVAFFALAVMLPIYSMMGNVS